MARDIEPTVFPVGTPDSIAEYGESPLVWGSCALPRSTHPKHGGPIAGCAHYESCIFKKDRPRNFGLYVELQSGANQQLVSSCFGYMGGYHDRANQQEASGEVIAIIADEGEFIEQTVRLSADPINCNKNGNMALVEKVVQVQVPKFPQPGEEGSPLSPKIHDTRSYAKRMIELRRQRHVDKKFGLSPESTVEDIAEQLETEPTAEPAKRGPGRPPKRAMNPSELGGS